MDGILPKIKIFTLGTLHVIRGDYAVTEEDWHTRQARQLLKILITERPRPVSTDRLVEILWPTSSPGAAATTLRSAINALRNVLEPDRPNRAPSRYIVTQTPGYAFHHHPDIWLDVEAFEHELTQARLGEGPAARRTHLSRAIDLYKDDYLISDPYADWVHIERERLQELYFNALLQLAEIEATDGDYPAAIAACRQVLARDEVRENAYQALMRYQAESGDSASALLTYERCRALLAEELGADPSPLTQSLHQRILNGEIEMPPVDVLTHHLRVGHLAPPLPSAAVHTALPQLVFMPTVDDHFSSVFVGREEETALLSDYLAAALDGSGGLHVLAGEAGVGKTRLATYILHQAAAADATVLSATCQSLAQQLPFAPLAESVGRYLHKLPDDAFNSLPVAGLSLLAPIIPSLQDRLPDLPWPTQESAFGAEDNRQRLIDGMVAFLGMLAQQRPLVLFIDDLHWSDHDTLTVLSRLSQRIADWPFLALLAYRTDELAANEGLATLLHVLNRVERDYTIPVTPLTQDEVVGLISALTGHHDARSADFAAYLYHATQGNALFLTEALRDLLERQAGATDGSTSVGNASLSDLIDDWSTDHRDRLDLWRNRRVQEVIWERADRLPTVAQEVLQVGSVIGRAFSLDLLEAAATRDPLPGLQELLDRKFLIELPEGQLDFGHQMVRQVVYDAMNALLRRRLHLRVAQALETLDRAAEHPSDTAFHFGQAGPVALPSYASYSVLAGEKLLRTFGFRQATVHFDHALDVLEQLPTRDADLIRRALWGRGVAYESLLDPEGVTDTYWRLQTWAAQQGDRQLMLAAHSRFTSMLTLLGRQRESNQLLGELYDALTATDSAAAHSRVLADLVARRRVIYAPESVADDDARWAAYTIPPPAIAAPAADLLAAFEPAYAVLPLFDYGWTLLVQGQLDAAAGCLAAVIDLADQTAQPSIASAAYHQLAVIARIRGDMQQSRSLNDRSVTINRAVPGAAAELASMWPRISSAFLSLQAARLDEAERRLTRVVAFLDGRNAFHNYRNSANIGLGLVALARDDRAAARTLLEAAVADRVNFYPYTHVRALLGLARIAARDAQPAASALLLRRALRFAGERSLLEEYIEVVLEIAHLRPAGAPVAQLLTATLDYARSIQLIAAADRLDQSLRAVTVSS